MDLSKKHIVELSDKTGFIKDNIEKALRLIEILEFIFSTKWKDKLVLKGGTGINLLYRDVERLSVDIDLDYIGDSRDEMIEDREQIKTFLSNYLFSKNYALSSKSRESFALSSMVFQYTNNASNIDNIKVEVNYLNRVHIFGVNQKCINNKLYNGKADIKVLNEDELYATKMNALLNRAKARDLFDIYNMIIEKHINNIDNFRKAVVFYNTIGGDIDLLSDNYLERIDSISKRDIDRQLRPMLIKGDTIDFDVMLKVVKDYTIDVMKLNENEICFIKMWAGKKFCPEILFGNNEKLKTHPMAIYRLMQIQKTM